MRVRRHALAAVALAAALSAGRVGGVRAGAASPRAKRCSRFRKAPGRGAWPATRSRSCRSEIRLTLGVSDVLVLRNHDDVPQIFGPDA